MPRFVACAALVVAAVTPLACMTAHPTVRSFSDACPAGWAFLYTDHRVSGGSERPSVVCRQDLDTTRTRP